MQYIYAIYLHAYQADLRCLPTATLVLSYTSWLRRIRARSNSCSRYLSFVMRSLTLPPPMTPDTTFLYPKVIQGTYSIFFRVKRKKYMIWWREMVFCGVPIHRVPAGWKSKKVILHQCWWGLLLPITFSDICLFIRGKKSTKWTVAKQLC